MNFIPALLKKTITFQRLPAKNVIAYEIYAKIPDSNYDSGIRNELLEVFDNPLEPEPRVKRIELGYNKDATWKLPNDAFLDRDHQFRLYINDVIVSSLCYNYNRINSRNLFNYEFDKVIKCCVNVKRVITLYSAYNKTSFILPDLMKIIILSTERK